MSEPLTEEQRELVQTVRALLAKHADHGARRKAMDSASGYDEGLWRLLCEQVGVAALAIPERFGGLGASLVESHLVVEELGRVLAPTPMFGSVVLGAQLLLAVGDDDACARLLPDIAAGARHVAVCWAGDRGWDEPGVAAGTAGKLSGTASYVMDGGFADLLLVVAQAADGLAVFEVDPAAAGVSRRTVAAMDPTRRLAVVEFHDVIGNRIGTSNTDAAVKRLWTIACAALSAEQVGAADECLRNTVEYTKSRVQFGRPIGSFQALKHRMADLYVLVQAARSASYAATAALASNATSAEEAAATAKVYCSDAFGAVAAESIQLHGGIAITWEHDAHLYFKRAHATAQLFGTPGYWVRRLGASRTAGAEETLT
jgi:alkylation response protein AidB-like acyl-CoA dehydrogenase